MSPGGAVHAAASSSAAPRAIVVAWVAIAVVVWNVRYDLQISLGTREYLLQAALHEAGLRPAVGLSEFMHGVVRNAIWGATLWASSILLAGMLTIRLLLRRTR